MHKKKVITAGRKLSEAKKALIMLHGRGASAEDILSVSSNLNVEDFAIVAPQATKHTWYPLSFLAPLADNEPWLSSALEVLNEIVTDIVAQGIKKENIYFLGFSQGACLSLEFVTRNATRWGGVVAYTGGLIGDKVYNNNYTGDFEGTPFFIGTSDPDEYVPVTRVNDSGDIINGMNGVVTVQIYQNMGHTISQDEIDQANALIFKSAVSKG